MLLLFHITMLQMEKIVFPSKSGPTLYLALSSRAPFSSWFQFSPTKEISERIRPGASRSLIMPSPLFLSTDLEKCSRYYRAADSLSSRPESHECMSLLDPRGYN